MHSSLATAQSGYRHRRYAEAVAESNRVLTLRRSQGYILQRPVPGFAAFDGAGCYPLFACSDWSGLPADLEELSGSLISVTVVTDPFGHYDVDGLKQCFPHLLRPFKRHYIVDLGKRPDTFVCAHHRRNVRKALRQVEVEVCQNPGDHVEDWAHLYDCLVQRHRIEGRASFSRQSLAGQISTPGLFMLRAIVNGETVGMVQWFLQDEVAYYHLGAYSEAGYQVGASYALFWTSIEQLSSRAAHLDLGGNAGDADSSENGLARFKRGWATGFRTNYLCGRIFDESLYTRICRELHAPATSYFPAYRYREAA